MRPSIHLAALALASLLATAPATEAQQQSDWYFQIGAGANDRSATPGLTRDISFDKGFNFSALAGRRIDWCSTERFDFAFELEALYMDDEFGSDGLLNAGTSTLEDIRSVSFLLNAVAEWRLAQDVYLYLGGGVGYASGIDLNTFGDGPPAVSGDPREFNLVDDSGLAYQGKLGLRYDLGGDRNFSWIVGGRFFAIEDLTATDRDLGQSIQLETQVLALETGLRWGI